MFVCIIPKSRSLSLALCLCKKRSEKKQYESNNTNWAAKIYGHTKERPNQKRIHKCCCVACIFESCQMVFVIKMSVECCSGWGKRARASERAHVRENLISRCRRHRRHSRAVCLLHRRAISWLLVFFCLRSTHNDRCVSEWATVLRAFGSNTTTLSCHFSFALLLLLLLLYFNHWRSDIKIVITTPWCVCCVLWVCVDVDAISHFGLSVLR